MDLLRQHGNDIQTGAVSFVHYDHSRQLMDTAGIRLPKCRQWVYQSSDLP